MGDGDAQPQSAGPCTAVDVQNMLDKLSAEWEQKQNVIVKSMATEVRRDFAKLLIPIEEANSRRFNAIELE